MHGKWMLLNVGFKTNMKTTLLHSNPFRTISRSRSFQCTHKGRKPKSDNRVLLGQNFG